MNIAVITTPLIDIRLLAQIVENSLETNPLRDTKGKIGSLEHHISLLNNLKQGYSDILTYIGVLAAVDERDAQELIEVLGMPHMVLETKFRGACLVYTVGRLLDFKSAFKRDASKGVKELLQQISYELEKRESK